MEEKMEVTELRVASHKEEVLDLTFSQPDDKEVETAEMPDSSFSRVAVNFPVTEVLIASHALVAVSFIAAQPLESPSLILVTASLTWSFVSVQMAIAPSTSPFQSATMPSISPC